ncbi:MAG: hypothetical protein GIW95_09265, partial [Candidatus Eremiobacteraeota bacterium]|nr:hypothetical protein [Candidatus Eremiobacteraeota bacterium]
AARVRTAEQIEERLLDLEAEPRNETWQQVGPEHWRLERPKQRVARDRRGRLIPHFAEQFHRLVATARKIAPHEDSMAFALRVLNVDRRAVRDEELQIDVVHRGDHWVASVRNGKGPARDLGAAASLAEAIGLAQTRVNEGDLPWMGRPHQKARGVPARKFRGRRRRPAPAA